MTVPRVRRAASVAAALLLAVAPVAACSSNRSSAAGDSRYIAGDGQVIAYRPGERRNFPRLAGTTLHGDPFDLSMLRGKIVVVNVWASWCPPCRAEAPALQRVATAFKNQGVSLVGLDVKDQKASAQAFQERFRLSYPSIDGSDGQAPLQLRSLIRSVPNTFVIDRTGKLAAAVYGGVSEPALRRMLQPVLAERP
jgi:thiol-disulfide isomerase/thioredoxin